MKIQLIDDCKRFWRLWSVWFAAFAATALASIAADPRPVLDFLEAIPPQWAWLKPIAVFLVSFIVPTVLRMLHQPGLTKAKPTDEGQG